MGSKKVRIITTHDFTPTSKQVSPVIIYLFIYFVY